MRKHLFLVLLTMLSLPILSKGQCTDPPNQPGSMIGNDPVCPGSTQTYYVIAVPGATSYVWTIPSGWTGSSTTNSITLIVGNNNGTIGVAASNNCGTSNSQNFYALVIKPAVTVSGPTTFCDGNNVVLSTPTGTGYLYQWQQNGNPLTGQTSSTYTATTSGTYTVQVATNNCQSISDPVAVTVNPNPATPVATSNSPVCLNTALNLTGNCTTPGVTYNWTGPNNFLNTQNPVAPTTQLTDEGTYTLTVVANNNCSSSSTTTVTTHETPVMPSIIAGPDHICPGTPTSYNTPNDLNADQYNWNFPNTWTGTSNTNIINVTSGSSGGTISVTAQNACGTSPAKWLNVTIDPVPSPVVIQAGNSLTTTIPYATYQWYLGTSPITGATLQTYTPTQTGNYFVFVQNSFGCSAQSLAFNSNALGVNNVEVGSAIQLYPNPNNGSFNIDGELLSNDGRIFADVIDITGRIVHKEQVTTGDNRINMQVTISADIAPGVYTLRLHSDVQTSVLPFVKN
jgi:hypothetical protein